MPSFELISSLAGALMFFALLVLLIINWRGQLIGGLLIAGAATSILFFFGVAYNANSGAIPLLDIRILEILRDVTWLTFLWSITRYQPDPRPSLTHKYLLPILTLGITLEMLYSLFASLRPEGLPGASLFGFESFNFGFLIFAIIGLVLIEHIYRNTRKNYRWAIKFLCLGLGGIFLYDFFIYSEAILFQRINPDFWFARGMINAVCVPLMVVSIRRVKEWKLELFVSRHMVFQSSMVLLAGLYLSFMALSGYYVRVFGGTWGGALQTVFIFTAILCLLVIVFSSTLRARIKIFLAKHFYENKYDYRDEWLGFTQTLAVNQADENIYKNIVKAFADTMKCKDGVIWLVDKDTGEYYCAGGWHINPAAQQAIAADSELIKFLAGHKWIINMDDYQANTGRYYNIVMPDPVTSFKNAALIIPLFSGEQLLGMILLSKSDINATYNWEDYDLLKTMGRQTAGLIDLLRTTEDLTEAKQFEAFNRLSAFVVHDMKNIAAQLSLISSNAKKFKNNPEFLQDAVDTIENAVTKMNRLTRTLKKGTPIVENTKARIDIGSLIKETVASRKAILPHPEITKLEPEMFVHAGMDRLAAVIEHLVQNAQEATSGEGRVEISLERINKLAVIKIADNGCGMDEDFIRTRLFRPFDTTKGNAGMGIGAFESREVVRELGGSIDVESTPGKGTTFFIQLPLIPELDSAALGMLNEA